MIYISHKIYLYSVCEHIFSQEIYFHFLKFNIKKKYLNNKDVGLI